MFQQAILSHAVSFSGANKPETSQKAIQRKLNFANRINGVAKVFEKVGFALGSASVVTLGTAFMVPSQTLNLVKDLPTLTGDHAVDVYVGGAVGGGGGFGASGLASLLAKHQKRRAKKLQDTINSLNRSI
ncbi:MAG: hypothetical protein VKJ06_04235 [Vampirovibrionales bacterium]|nr:hypothetical protein [Vampirovibrionales bacterium]